MGVKLDDSIKRAEERLARLEERKKQAELRKEDRVRSKDTRRKVLLGALVLHRLENANDPEFTKRLGDWLRRELPGFLTRDNDKALFTDLLAPAQAQPDTAPASQG